IPARYASGYSVNEFSRLENMYIVRARHAHSWALVYVGGAWQEFDTTPAVWFDADGSTASFWEPVSDLWSWSLFLFSKWRWTEQEGGVVKHVVWHLIPHNLFLVWRLYFKKRLVRIEKGQPRQNDAARSYPGKDSEFFVIEKRLSEMGFPRYPSEPLSTWVQRIHSAQATSLTDSLPAMASLHYRYRFDPNGISESERQTLKSNVQFWLDQHKTTQ
ncbi:MAG: transglutaminase domain-containing protein, partial [Nitrospirales bacterium]